MIKYLVLLLLCCFCAVQQAEAKTTVSATPPVPAFHHPKTQAEYWLNRALQGERLEDSVYFYLIAGDPLTTPRAHEVAKLFTPALVQKLRAEEQKELDENCGGHFIEGELCDAGYHKTICAQDDNDGYIVYKTLSSSNNKATIAMAWSDMDDYSVHKEKKEPPANFPISGHRTNFQPAVTYEMVKHGNQWKVNDISCPD